eukprot:g3483.t1
MKTVLLITLLALCSNKGTAEVVSKSRTDLFSAKARTLKAATPLNEPMERVSVPRWSPEIDPPLSPSPKVYITPKSKESYKKVLAFQCSPLPYINYNYVYNGRIMSTTYRISVTECIENCEKATLYPTCMAINYVLSTATCYMLSYSGNLVSEKGAISALIRFSTGGICSPYNYVRDYYRPGSNYYTSVPGRIKSPTECCKLCQEQYKICMAWDYNAKSATCSLKNAIPLLEPAQAPDIYTSSVAAYCYGSRPDA